MHIRISSEVEVAPQDVATVAAIICRYPRKPASVRKDD
jgi:hypothetical protein